jgi:hypothetical protein
MKKIMVINLDGDSHKIAGALQKFYGDKAKVDVMEITDRPINVDIFFGRGADVCNPTNRNLLKELVKNNEGCKMVAYYDSTYESDLIFDSYLHARFTDEGFHTDNKFYKENLLSWILHEKDELLKLLNQREKFYFVPTPDKDWAEY